MQFATYSDFRNAFLTLLTGDSPTTASLDYGQTELMISMGEDRVYRGDAMERGLRASTMVTTVSLPVTANAITLPADFIEAALVYQDRSKPIEVVGHFQMFEDARSSGYATVCTQIGNTLQLSPDITGNVTLVYYARPAALKDGPNSTFNKYPALFMYACLCEGAAFLGLLQSMPVWEQKFKSDLASARRQEQIDAFSGSRLRVRQR